MTVPSFGPGRMGVEIEIILSFELVNTASSEFQRYRICIFHVN